MHSPHLVLVLVLVLGLGQTPLQPLLQMALKPCLPGLLLHLENLQERAWKCS